MSRDQEGSDEPNEINKTKPLAEVVDFAEAKAKRAEKPKLAQAEKSPDFETEKREFLDKAREQLASIRKRTESQRAEMEARQVAIDSRMMIWGQLSQADKSTRESRQSAGDRNIKEAFEVFERNLVLAEEIDSPDSLVAVRQSFQESLELMESELDKQEKVLGRIPEKELAAMPEMVRREVLQQQRIGETFPAELEGRLRIFSGRLDLLTGLVNPEAIKKLRTAILDAENILSNLKLMPGLKRLEQKSLVDGLIGKIDQAIRAGEEQSKKRR